MKKDGLLTFSLREGYVELPLPLQIEELPSAARVAIWNALYAQMRGSRRWVGTIICIDDPWETILRDLYLYHDNMRLDKWLPTFDHITTWMQERLEGHRFNQVFDVVEFLMQHDCCPPQFITDLSGVFSRFQLAYTIRPGPQPMILPATTVEEGNELSRNLTELQDAGLDGCETHLRNASKYINEGRWADSVRESIHAVESVAKKDQSQRDDSCECTSTPREAGCAATQGSQGSTGQALRLHIGRAGHSSCLAGQQASQGHH